MLILSRKEGEGITLTLPSGEHIEIVVAEYRGQQTLVGISAPDDIVILRNELLSSDFSSS